MGHSLGKNKHFITLMTAQAISSLGDWLSIVAIITLVGLKWEATPMQMSFIILSLAMPMALLGPISGTIADRMERKKLMVFSDVVEGGLCFFDSSHDCLDGVWMFVSYRDFLLSLYPS